MRCSLEDVSGLGWQSWNLKITCKLAKRLQYACELTIADLEDMSCIRSFVNTVPSIWSPSSLTSIIGLNEHNLIFMVGVQLMQIILEDTEMEDSRIAFFQIAIPLSDELGTAEPVLRVGWVSTGYKDGCIVNFDVNLNTGNGVRERNGRR